MTNNTVQISEFYVHRDFYYVLRTIRVHPAVMHVTSSVICQHHRQIWHFRMILNPANSAWEDRCIGVYYDLDYKIRLMSSDCPFYLDMVWGSDDMETRACHATVFV